MEKDGLLYNEKCMDRVQKEKHNEFVCELPFRHDISFLLKKIQMRYTQPSTISSNVDKCIKDIGPEKIIQGIMDSASNNMAAVDIILTTRPNLFWTLCATHTLNLMLEGISKIKVISFLKCACSFFI